MSNVITRQVRSRLLRWVPPEVRSIVVGSLPLFIALSVQNLSNLIFHVVVSRLIGPAAYGELAALLSVALVISVPVGVVQTVAAKRIATLRTEPGNVSTTDVLRSMTKTLAILGAALMLVVIVATPPVTSFLHVSWRPTILIGPYLYASLLTGLALGALQGSLRFTALATVVASGVLVRLALGVGLTAAGLGVEGAMLATVASAVFQALFAMTLTRVGWRTWRDVRVSFEPFRGEFGLALLALGSFALFAQLDLVLARHFLSDHEAGLYSGAGLIARVVLFLPGAVAVVAFPRFAAMHAAGERALRWLHLSMAAVAALVLGALPFVALGSEPLVVRVLGENYRTASDIVPVLAIAMGAMAIVNLLVFFHVAAETRAHRMVFLAIGALGLIISIEHNSPHRIAVGTVVIAVGTIAFMYHAARAASVWPRYRSGPDQGRSPTAPSVDVSVVLPCFNSGPALHGVLSRLLNGALEPSTFEIIVVSDGSTDDTLDVARSFGEPVRAIEISHSGKGGALRAGMAVACGRYVAFMDSDGDIQPEDLRPFVSLMELYQPDIVLGSKRHPMSNVNYPAARRVMSWVYHKLARLLFRVNVRDTQTGLKVVRRDVLDVVLPRMLEKRFAFDLELLVVAHKFGFRRVFEAPIRLSYRFTSNVDVRQTFRIVLDTLAIFYRRYVLDTYSEKATGHDKSRSPVNRSESGTPLPGGLRILFLNWRDPRNPDAGGAEFYTHEVAKELIARGHSVSLLTSRFRGAPATEDIDGVSVRRLGRLRLGTYYLLVQRELARLRGIDLVVDEINSIPFFTPLWGRRLPSVVAVIHQLARDVWYAELPRPFAAVASRVERMLLRLYRDTPTIALSESTREDLAELSFSRIAVVPPGLNVEEAAAGFSVAATAQPPTLLYLGRLAANKRPDHALEAFRIAKTDVPDLRLSIVGRGQMEKSMRASLPADVTMHGYVERSELWSILQIAYCLVVPSTREGFGLVVLEANAAGVPAVGYDVAGLRDAIRHEETGVLVTAGDPAALAAACVRLLHDPVTRDRLGRNARSFATQFSWRATTDAFLDALTTLGVVPAHQSDVRVTLP